MEILEIKDLRKSFKNVDAVNGLSLTVKKGEIHGILGPNGAGKTTTMGCILGLIPYDSGSVVYEGKYSANEWKRNIGYVPQAFALYDELSAEQNVKFFGSFSKLGYLHFNIAYQNYIPASSSVSQLLL